MPFVAPKTTTSSTTGNAAGRTSFRPPWVKDDGPQSALKPTTKTSIPWAKKNAEAKETENSNSILKKPATTSTNSAKTNAEPSASLKKTNEPVKKTNEPVKKITTPLKKEPETVKKPLTTTKTSALSKKKEPTPPSSSEEEESEEEEEEETEEEEEETEEETSEEEEESEEETEEESEEEVKDVKKKTTTAAPNKTNNNNTTSKATTTAAGKKIIPPKTQPLKKEEEESELKRRFSLEKPKLRPVVVKRDKSMKKIEDDDEAVEDETEEERERRLRFKLDKPQLRHVKREEKPLPNKSTENILKNRPVLKKVPTVEKILKETKEEPKPEFKTKTLRKTPSIKREPSIKNVPAPPPLPSLVPKAPPPPPPPLGQPGDKRTLTESQKQALEKLKTRPRRRPDWSEMMKEVESGKKLRHVECNDRSQPILTCKSMTKVDNKFIYETEKDNSHNKLLKQIQGGVKLRKTQTNDRSKPFIEGLRKFRRQMTIEEQLQKSQSKVNMLGSAPGAAAGDTTDGAANSTSSTRTGSIVSALVLDDPSGDELDDIDKIRDDLQSTKQMLALELRNREAQERENKKLLAKIATLEAELEREKSREKTLEYGSRIIVATMETTPASEEAYLNSLKQEAEESKKTAKDLEKKYLTTGELLDQAKSEIEEQKRQIQMLERKLAQALQGGGLDSRRASDVHNGRDSSPDFDLAESESDPDEPEEKKAERREKRMVKEVKMLRSKLTKLKVKEEAAKKEKMALKEAMKKNHIVLKEEKKKFKKLEKEVHKMAASMKEDADEDEENEDDEDKEAEEEEESDEESEEESEESESEESGNETESESEAEDAPTVKKKENLEPRAKKHEGRLSAMKKCNVLLQANVDNLQDEISQVRYKASNLQSELDSVLADLGF